MCCFVLAYFSEMKFKLNKVPNYLYIMLYVKNWKDICVLSAVVRQIITLILAVIVNALISHILTLTFKTTENFSQTDHPCFFSRLLI